MKFEQKIEKKYAIMRIKAIDFHCQRYISCSSCQNELSNKLSHTRSKTKKKRASIEIEIEIDFFPTL